MPVKYRYFNSGFAELGFGVRKSTQFWFLSSGSVHGKTTAITAVESRSRIRMYVSGLWVCVANIFIPGLSPESHVCLEDREPVIYT